MLSINNLTVSIQDETKKEKCILNDFNLQINPGEVHAIMGPNGCGKSTLANVLAGKSNYAIQAGDIFLNNESLLALSPDERAHRGLFLAFQYPLELPGVNNMYFLRTAVNSIRKQNQEPLLDAADFLTLIKAKIKAVGLDEQFLHRAVNEGFSGGEKKRNEVLQMLLLKPNFIILDETDSGLDIDALQQLGSAVQSLRDKHRSFLMITHYERLLNYIKPDVVHIMAQGKIIHSGGIELAKKLEVAGYAALIKEAS